MKFKRLIGIKTDIDQYIELYGASADAVRACIKFNQFMQKKYTDEERGDPAFVEMEVPADVIDAFRPIYDMYREANKDMADELPILK